MVKFDLISCALMICVSDDRCMKLCDEHSFPCFHYNALSDHLVVSRFLYVGTFFHVVEILVCFNLEQAFDHDPSPMEQIAVLKLNKLPKTLARGVDVFTLDLDAGFVDDPRKLVSIFYESKKDIFVQVRQV